jgi:hypothetical protein
MTDTKTETETVELTNALFQCLLNMTGGDPELDMEPKRNLSRALHNVHWNMGGRWVVELTEEDIKTIHVLILGYTLNDKSPAKRTRFHNYMCHQSKVYWRLYRFWEAK